MRNYYLDVTALVLTATRPVNVRQAYLYALYMLVPGAQGKAKATFNMATKGVRKWEVASLNINLHNIILCNV